MDLPRRHTKDRPHRPRDLTGGAILTDINQSEARCIIRNQTDNGAELRVSKEIVVPPEFLLYIAIDQIAYRSVLRWLRVRESVSSSLESSLNPGGTTVARKKP